MARRTYSLDFKASAAKLVTEQGRGNSRTSPPASASPPAPCSTGSVASAPRPPGPRPPTTADALRRENDRLREENERLLMERDILKKATAFFAREQA